MRILFKTDKLIQYSAFETKKDAKLQKGVKIISGTPLIFIMCEKWKQKYRQTKTFKCLRSEKCNTSIKTIR